MRIAIAAVLLALAGCQPSLTEAAEARKAARLERELRQAKAEELQGLLETRTSDFNTVIEEAERR